MEPESACKSARAAVTIHLCNEASETDLCVRRVGFQHRPELRLDSDAGPVSRDCHRPFAIHRRFRARKETFAGLIAALAKADARLSKAIEHRNVLDTRRATAGRLEAVGARTNAPSKKEERRADHEEGRAHEDTAEALQALCKYRPRTPEELSKYTLTLFSHWSIRDASFEDEHDRACLCAFLSNVNAATVALVFRKRTFPRAVKD
jgi:hypothetical protein